MFSLEVPAIMGILNVTPDSFSDGGRFVHKPTAIRHAQRMIDEGAHIVDIGGESTRPGADPVPVDLELQRVIPVIEAIRSISDIPISVDTSTAQVITEAARAGANMINDVRALRREGALAAAALTGLPVCIMHMQGDPKTMQMNPGYQDLVGEIVGFFEDRMRCCEGAGIVRENIILDPGFGFGKTPDQNLTLINRLDAFCALGRPVLVGLSRKSTIARITGEAGNRLIGSIAGAVMAVARGASIIRVHDVAETAQALRVAAAVMREHAG